MRERPQKSRKGAEIVDQWDDRDFLGRLRLILEYRKVFLDHHLVTESELAMVDRIHQSNREYIVKREDQPFFTSLNLKKTLAMQIHRANLRAALKAVFLNSTLGKYREVA